MPHLAQGDQWRLTFNDGSTADFNSHAEADAARWQWTGDQFGHVHAATREALASLERNLPALREVAVRIDPHTREVTRAEAEQSTSIQDRMAQGRLFGELPSQTQQQQQQPQQIDSGLDDAAALTTAEGVPTEVVARILGSSRNHHDAKTGILTTTIRLYEGADVLTLVEEKLEGDAKVILATPAGRDWMLTHLRAYEQASGEKLFTIPADGDTGTATNADAQLTDAMLVEAWSHLGQSYLVGSSSHGAPASGGSLRGFLDSLMQSGLGGLMSAQSTYWGAVAARAQKLVDLKREGKLGSDLTAELERQLGIGAGTRQSLEWNTETGTATNSQGETSIAAGGETYSFLSPFEFPKFILRKYHEALDNWKKTRHDKEHPAERAYIHLGKTPPVLRVAGANDLPMVIPPGLFRKVLEDSHEVPIEALEALPQSLADPVAIFQSRREGDSILVLTEYVEPGKGPIVITVRLDQMEGRTMVINKVTSFYGRPPHNLIEMFDEAPIYVNQQKKKSLAWARQAGKQYSRSGTPSQGQRQFKTPEDVVKWTQEQQASQGQSKLNQTPNAGETLSLRAAGEGGLNSQDKPQTQPSALDFESNNSNDYLDANSTDTNFRGMEEIVRTDEAGSLGDAETHLRRSLRPDGRIDEDDFDYLERERAELWKWAENSGLVLPDNFLAPTRMGGREHDVRFDEATNRWWKYTKASASGYTVEWTSSGEPYLVNSLPIEYLHRLRLMNALFGDDIRLEGLWRESRNNWRIVTSQPDIQGSKSQLDDLIEAFKKAGFKRLPWSGIGYKDSVSFRKGGYDIWDVHPANVLLGPTGRPLPIDVIITPTPPSQMPSEPGR